MCVCVWRGRGRFTWPVIVHQTCCIRAGRSNLSYRARPRRVTKPKARQGSAERARAWGEFVVCNVSLHTLSLAVDLGYLALVTSPREWSLPYSLRRSVGW